MIHGDVPAENKTPPTMTIGIRHSGTGMLLFAFKDLA